MSNQDHVEEIGIKWAQNQAKDLFDKGVPNVHFYVMNNANAVIQVINSFK